MAGKKKNIVTQETQPKAVKLNTGVDLNEIGKDTIIVHKDAPQVKKKTEIGGKSSTEFKPVGEDMGTVSRRDILQPFIKEADVKKMGICKWYQMPGNPNVFSTVVNGRRFKMHIADFEDCKNKGLVIRI